MDVDLSITEDSLEESLLENGPFKSCRLSKDILPDHYYLLIHPNLEEDTFDGQVAITINVLKPTWFICVHQTNLDIWKTKLTSNSEEVPIRRTFSFPQNQYWVIMLVSELPEGQYELLFNYRGKLGNGTLGLYKSSYINPNDEESICMLSYFEATYARCAFPCFDEPSFRAKFAIKISHVANGRLIALSNMCRDKETLNYPQKGINTVHFKVTPPMPPYLVALILGDFSYTTPLISKDGLSVAVYSRPEILNAMTKARDFAARIVDFFSNYFDFPLPLSKLDLIALPNSNIGGMENWGMITFKEGCLMLNEESTCDDLVNVLNIIGHEISHMWFGDLVCIDWWDNLWLKEGFATYMAYVAGAEIFPEWFNEWVVQRSLLSALQMDATLSSHPILQTVNTPAEIREVFDSISYEKGCSLIRMLQDLAPEGFQLGVNSYLKKYQLKSAVTQNLWDEIQEKVNFQVVSFLDTWINQMGFPVIHVDKCDVDKITVSQSRFLLDKNSIYDPNTSPYRYRWDVPIKYISSDDPKNIKLSWLMKDQQTAVLDIPPNANWIKLNWHQKGFYRVNYPLSLWEAFSTQLMRNPLVLDVEDRVSLIDDAFSLACAGHFHYHVPLNLIKYLQYGNEKHFYPWAVTSNYLRFIAAKLVGTNCHALFMNYVLMLLKRNLSEEMWDFGASKSFLEKKLQIELIKLACWAEEEKALEKVKKMFAGWIESCNPINVELSQIVFSYGLSAEVTQDEWDTVLGRCLAERSVKQKLNLWRSLGNVKNKEYLKELIELAKDENNMKSQDFFVLLRTIVRLPVGLEVVWDFVRNEWLYLVDRFTLEDMGLCDTVFQACSQFGTLAKLNETKDFFARYPDAGAGARSRQRAIECILHSIEWMSINYEPIKDWLTDLDKNMKMPDQELL